jgi:hypothetical protein
VKRISENQNDRGPDQLSLALQDSFCTYLQLEYSEQAKAAARQAEASLLLPAIQQRLTYGRPVLRILPLPDDTLITLREDGTIYFWSLQLKLKRKKPIFVCDFHLIRMLSATV